MLVLFQRFDWKENVKQTSGSRYVAILMMEEWEMSSQLQKWEICKKMRPTKKKEEEEKKHSSRSQQQQDHMLLLLFSMNFLYWLLTARVCVRTMNQPLLLNKAPFHSPRKEDSSSGEAGALHERKRSRASSRLSFWISSTVRETLLLLIIVLLLIMIPAAVVDDGDDDSTVAPASWWWLRWLLLQRWWRRTTRNVWAMFLALGMTSMAATAVAATWRTIIIF